MQANQTLFKPQNIEGFEIRQGNMFDPKNPDLIVLKDVKAHGHGTHEATRGCITAIKTLHNGEFKPQSALDVGSGSGILSIAAVKLFNCPIEAIDEDLEAVEATKMNSKINFVKVQTHHSDISTYFNAFADEKRDLIMANLLCDVIVRKMPTFAQAMSPQGRLVVSGYLLDEEQKIAQAATHAGLRITQKINVGNWQTSILAPFPSPSHE